MYIYTKSAMGGYQTFQCHPYQVMSNRILHFSLGHTAEHNLCLGIFLTNSVKADLIPKQKILVPHTVVLPFQHTWQTLQICFLHSASSKHPGALTLCNKLTHYKSCPLVCSWVANIYFFSSTRLFFIL